MSRVALALAFVGAACTPPGPPPVTAEAARAKRLACAFARGAMPADTLETGAPVGAAMPVDHIVLVMQENRSFDHYFSKLSHGGVNVAAADATNPDAEGNPVARHLETRLCVDDVTHSWNGSHKQWNAGANDGFVRAAGGSDPARALGYYDDAGLPFYYALARTFAISDAHFCSLLGPTLPNRMYYFAGTSFGRIRNTPPPTEDAEGQKFPNLFSRLNDAGVSWKVYSKNAPSPAMFILLFSDFQDRFVAYTDFAADAAAGTLPAVSVVEANFQPGTSMPRDDEHAPSNIQLGQKFTEEVVRALLASPLWPRSVLFLTYDEHGGFYDHVPPPAACLPDDIPPERESGDVEGAFDRYGFRVPLIAVSPYARRGHVSHFVSSAASVLRFVETRFSLPAMTARDANAEPLLDLFDFERPDLTVPDLPAAALDPDERARCLAAYPDQG